MVDLDWESTNSVKDWTSNNWNLLKDRVRSEKKSVLLGPVLNELLVLVELLQVVERGDLNVDSLSLDLISVLLVGNQTDLETWSWDIWEADGSDETLVLLWVVILKTNLELDGLGELSLLGGLLAHLLHVLEHDGVVNSTGHPLIL